MRMMRMMRVMRVMFLLNVTNSAVWMLPSPASVSMESVDMRHVLKWRPLQARCVPAVLYSVQFQGEFELTQNRWVDAPDCQLIPLAQCDLTFDLGSDSDYNLRIRAQCGSQRSAWTDLQPPFNRRDTVLVAPEMAVTVAGDALQVSFLQLPPTAVVMVTVWKKGHELQAAVYSMPAEQVVLHVAALQEGAQYCVRAHTALHTRNSSSTDTECVSIAGRADGAWRRPTAVSVSVVLVVLVVLVSGFRFAGAQSACRTHFLKEPLPRSLEPDWDIKIPMRPEEAELCQPIHVTS
uniref:cytokine receptor family member B16 isoform X2 n=1 Tax=Gasterosteus aculeatus aculeatus TaxID=481459 RepID=UPI001A980D38|nr:cytokine receptor family member B16 isoform X2 [Gasterosteus aculeatus aculeatus]